MINLNSFIKLQLDFAKIFLCLGMLKNDQEVVVDLRVHEVRKLETENQKEETEIGKGIVIENVTAGIAVLVL